MKLHTVNLRAMTGVPRYTSDHAETYKNCYALKNINVVTANKADLHLEESPLITLESWQKIISVTPQSVVDAGGYGIFVHPDVWAKLMGEMDPEHVPAMTVEEAAAWGALVTAAAAKNITFATA